MRKRQREFMDLLGQRYGSLTVTGGGEVPSLGTPRKWACVCDCGTVIVAAQSNLRSGHTTSCGCLKVALGRVKNLKHGKASGGRVDKALTALYGARQRCLNPANVKYRDYGGRGITVCQEWLDDPQKFLDHIGPRPHGQTLDRIDVNGNYEPGNVRWATLKTQSGNRRPSSEWRFEKSGQNC